MFKQVILYPLGCINTPFLILGIKWIYGDLTLETVPEPPVDRGYLIDIARRLDQGTA